MSDLISRAALLATLRKERDDYLAEHFHQDPDTGTWEASNAKEEYLSDLDERIEAIEQFPAATRPSPAPDLERIADVIEPHWRGAGLKPTADWIIEQFVALGDKVDASSDVVEALKQALEFIRDGYERGDINHVDFRVGAFWAATEALTTLQRGGGA